MVVLFLGPFVLAPLAGLLVYATFVWRGRFHHWFGRADAWSVLAWPLPLLVLIVPVAAGGGLAILRLMGAEPGSGGIVAAAVYSTIYLVPLVLLSVWPPRWLLPGWARARLTELPEPDPAMPAGALPALHARRGHGSAARWVWRVDAVPGFLWLDTGRLCFRARPDAEVAGGEHAWELEEAAIEGLRFSPDDVLVVESPRGGWWSRGHLDVELSEIDRFQVRHRRRWRKDGLLSLEVDGRQPAHLWVADVRTLAEQMPVGRASGGA